MTLAFGPVEPGDGQFVIARCVLLWNGRYIGTLEKVVHGKQECYQWSRTRLSALTRDDLLDEVVAVCQDEDAPQA